MDPHCVVDNTITMADQLRSNELFQLLNTRNNSLMEVVSELVQAGQDGASVLSPEMVAKLNAMRDAPMSKALDKEDLWKNRLREEIAAYQVPVKTMDDVHHEFSRANSEFMRINGWCYNIEQSIKKRGLGYFQFHPLTGRTDPNPILYPYEPEINIFYTRQCVRRSSESKLLNLPLTIVNVFGVAKEMGLSWEQIDRICRQIMEQEMSNSYEDIRDLKDPVEFVEAMVGLFDFRTEKRRVLRLMKMCNRRVGVAARVPVVKYKNLVKELIMLEGIQMAEEVVTEKAEREAKKIIFKFVEKNTSHELKDYISKRTRDDASTGNTAKISLNELLEVVEKLEKMPHLRLQSDKQLLSVEHEISLFYTNLADIELELSDIRAIEKDLDAVPNSLVEMIFHTTITPPYDPTRTAVQNQVSSNLLVKPDKTVETEKPRGRSTDRSTSRTRRSSSARSADGKNGVKKTVSDPKKNRKDERVELRDAATDDALCVICGEPYAEQKGAKCSLKFCAEYQKPTKYREPSFWCKYCAEDKKVKAYHPRVWCKSKFLKHTQALFHARPGDSEDSDSDDENQDENKISLN